MTIDIAIAPTVERQRKSTVIAAHKDQKVSRQAYQAIGLFERLLRDQDIAPGYYEAARKYEKHYLGSLGVDVRTDDGYNEDAPEFPRSYHAEMVMRSTTGAKLTKVETWALQGIIEGLFQPRRELEDIGRQINGWSCRKMCKGYGLSTVTCALHRLAQHWGLPLPET